MTEFDGIMLPVNDELGYRIVITWLRQRLEWAQDTFDNSIHEKDKADAASDIIAFQWVLNYAGGEFDD